MGIDFWPDLPSNFKSGKVALVDDNRFGKNIPAHRYLRANLILNNEKYMRNYLRDLILKSISKGLSCPNQ